MSVEHGDGCSAAPKAVGGRKISAGKACAMRWPGGNGVMRRPLAPPPRRPNPTDPGDAADLSIPQGYQTDRAMPGHPPSALRHRVVVSNADVQG